MFKKLNSIFKLTLITLFIIVLAACIWALVASKSDTLTYLQGSIPSYQKPLTITFSNSTAPLESINSTHVQGISMSPRIKGTWYWGSARVLRFTPQNKWPANTKFNISFASNALNKNINLNKNPLEVTTPDLTPIIDSFSFYIDPKNPSNKSLIATIKFNYPVKAQDIKQHTKLFYQQLNHQTNIPFTIKLADNNKTAYLTSSQIQIPKHDQFPYLRITKGLDAATGGSSNTPAQKSTEVFAINNLLKVSTLNAKTLKDKHNKPFQALQVNTNIAVSNNSINRSIKAYLLPKYFNPKQRLIWQRTGQVTADTLKKATPVTLTALESPLNYAPAHLFKFNAPPQRQLYIVITPNVTGLGGYKLGQTFQKLVWIPSYPKTLSFTRRGSLMDTSTDQQHLTVQSRGVSAVKFKIAKILPDDLNQFVTQTYGNFSDPKLWQQYRFNYSNMSELHNDIIPLNSTNLESLQHATVNLAKYYKKDQLGLFHVSVTGWDVKNKYQTTQPIQRVVLITNMSIISKKNQDGSRNVYVINTRSSKPVAGAQISVLAKNGLTLFHTTTNSNGMAHLPSFKNNDNNDQNQPVAIIAKQGDDTSFLTIYNYYLALNTSTFDIGGIYIPPESPLKAYAFTDRGLYQPGDTIHIAAIIKNMNWIYHNTKDISGTPITVRITGPRYNKVLEKKVRLSPSGLITLDYPSAKTALSGRYSVSFLIPNKNYQSQIGNTSFTIRGYQPSTMKLSAKFINQHHAAWINPNKLAIKLHIQNLFGAPANAISVDTTMTVGPGNFSITKFPGYVFFDPTLDPKQPIQPTTRNLPTVKTDAQGNAILHPNLHDFNNKTYFASFNIHAQPQSGGNPLQLTKIAVISPLDALIGSKTNGSLNFIRLHAKRSINFIAVDNHQKTTLQNDLTLHIFKIKQVMSLVKQPNDTYDYSSIDKNIPLSQHSFTIYQKGSQLPLQTNKAGRFLMTLTNADNQTVSKLTYTVVGPGENTLARDAKLDISLDKKTYQPGSTINVALNAPYPGSGLISIELNHVVTQHWFHSTTKSTVQSIKIPENFNGNGYVSVLWFKPYHSKLRHINPLSYAIAPFAVSHQKQTLSIDLTTPRKLISGHELAIHYKTNKPAKIIIYAVDQGILQLAHYQTPNPLGFYFDKRRLGVRTSENASLIMPYYRAPGGGKRISLSKMSDNLGMPRLIGANGLSAVLGGQNASNPFSRQIHRPVAFWSGVINATTKEHVVHFKVPNFYNGNLRIMAVAAANNAMGSTQQSVLAYNHFIIQPNLPTFVAPNDQFGIGVTVHNTLKQKTPLSLSLNAPGFTVPNNKVKNFTLAPGADKTVIYKLKASTKLGAKMIILKASGDNKTSTLTQSISIRPATLYQTQLTSAIGSQTANTQIKATYYLQNQKRIAIIGTTPRIYVKGLMRLLKNTQSTSTSQLANRLYALSVIAPNKTNAIINIISNRQLSSGDFTAWPNQSQAPQNQATLLDVIDALTQAQQAGITIPESLSQSALAYLQRLTGSGVGNPLTTKQYARSCYLLSQNGMIVSNRLARLQLYLSQNKINNWRQSLTGAYMAGAFEQMKEFNQANSLIDSYDRSKKSLADNAEYDIILANNFSKRFTQSATQTLQSLIKDVTAIPDSTLSTSRSIVALTKYADLTNHHKLADLTIAQKLPAANDFQSIKKGNAVSLKTRFAHAAIALQFDAKDTNHFYYQIIHSGFPKAVPMIASESNLQLYSELTDDKGQQLHTLKLGQTAHMIIRVRSLNQNTHKNYLFVSLLPGGVSVIPQSNSVTGMQSVYGAPPFVDLQSDRVLFTLMPNQNSQTFVYKVTAVTPGQFILPPVYAQSLTQMTTAAHSAASRITITP